MDLYPLSIFPIDLYLANWIAHLQPIYADTNDFINKIYEENKWVKVIIPAYDARAQNILNIQPVV